MDTFRGVHHGGIGVSDMERSLEFYREVLGFSELIADYSGDLPGMERVTGRPQTVARVAFLRNPRASRLGPGMIKLVQLLPPDGPDPIPDGTCWGEVGVAEVCVHVQGADAVLERLVNAHGCRQLMAIDVGPALPPREGEVAYAYIEEPNGGKIELIEFRPSPGFRAEPAIEGLTHVAFGVSDADRSSAFYRGLGFTDLVADFQGVLDTMSHWFPDPKGQEQRLVLLDSPEGAGIEAVQQINQTKDCRGSWGHLGPMEFAIEVRDMDAACAGLRDRGIELLCSPQTIIADGVRWSYVYFAEPDGIYVSLIQPGF